LIHKNEKIYKLNEQLDDSPRKLEASPGALNSSWRL
jgi:hypothetical protein